MYITMTMGGNSLEGEKNKKTKHIEKDKNKNQDEDGK